MVKGFAYTEDIAHVMTGTYCEEQKDQTVFRRTDSMCH